MKIKPQDWIYFFAPLIPIIALLIWHKNNGAAAILTVCLLIMAFILWLLLSSPDKDDKKDKSISGRFNELFGARSVSDDSDLNGPAQPIVQKFKSCLKEATESLKMLLLLRRKLHSNTGLAKDSAEQGLHRYALLCIMDLEPDDPRVVAGVDVINEILHTSASKAVVLSEELDSRDFADNIIRVTSRFVDGFVGSKGSNGSDDSRVNAFDTYGYKFLMSIGLLAMDCESLKNRIGDKGGIALVLKCLKGTIHQPQFCKWCCWTLINLVEMHPPNKRQFVVQGGILIVILALRDHSEKIEVCQQGLVLLFYILSNDPKTKMSLTGARQMALTHGVVEVVQSAQRKFKSPEVQATATGILEILISDWA